MLYPLVPVSIYLENVILNYPVRLSIEKKNREREREKLLAREEDFGELEFLILQLTELLNRAGEGRLSSEKTMCFKGYIYTHQSYKVGDES